MLGANRLGASLAMRIFHEALLNLGVFRAIAIVKIGSSLRDGNDGIDINDIPTPDIVTQVKDLDKDGSISVSLTKAHSLVEAHSLGRVQCAVVEPPPAPAGFALTTHADDGAAAAPPQGPAKASMEVLGAPHPLQDFTSATLYHRRRYRYPLTTTISNSPNNTKNVQIVGTKSFF